MDTIRVRNLDSNRLLSARTQQLSTNLVAFYPTLALISVLTSILSFAVLPYTTRWSPLYRPINGLVFSAALTSTTCMPATIALKFRFEIHGPATRKDLVVACSPFALLGLAITEFLVAMTLLYVTQAGVWRSIVMGVQMLVLGLYAVWTFVLMWRSLEKKGGEIGLPESE